MGERETAKLVYDVGRALYDLVIVTPALRSGELGDRMFRPVPGDLVIEVTSTGPFDADYIGRLEYVRRHPADSTHITEWAIQPLGDPRNPHYRRTFGPMLRFVAIPDAPLRVWLNQ